MSSGSPEQSGYWHGNVDVQANNDDQTLRLLGTNQEEANPGLDPSLNLR